MVRELPIKAARDCCFSTGGQYFAATNGNTVHVYCTYTAASLAVLRGHNGKVGLGLGEQGGVHGCGGMHAGPAVFPLLQLTQLLTLWSNAGVTLPDRWRCPCAVPRAPLPCSASFVYKSFPYSFPPRRTSFPPEAQVHGLWWSSDDATLVTAGMDGAVYEWRVLEGRRTRDFVQKGWNYTCVVSGPTNVTGTGSTAASHMLQTAERCLPPAAGRHARCRLHRRHQRGGCQRPRRLHLCRRAGPQAACAGGRRRRRAAGGC